MLIDEYCQYDAVGLAGLIHDGRATASEILECAIALTEKLNPALNAVVVKDYEAAREVAQSGSLSDGPLAGVPFLIKDIAAVRGLPQSRASRLFAGEIAHADSHIVARFREAGLLSFGKTNTPELCVTITTESRHFGPCQNPDAPGYSTGGSSGGAAAAVAAGIIPAAHGSDGGGSIRVPASCCGLVGLKPSRGLTVGEEDSAGTWSGLSVNHVLTRTIRDSAAFLDVLRVQSPGAGGETAALVPPLFAVPAHQSYLATCTDHPGPLRIAIQREHPAGLPVHADCLTALEHGVQRCRDQGFSLTDAAPPVDYARITQAMIRIINTHVAQTIIPAIEARGLTLESAPVEEATRRMAAAGSQISAADYLAATDVLRQAQVQMAAFHRDFDVVLSPVLAMPPARLGWLDMDSQDMKIYGKRFAAYGGFAALYNGTGQPSLSLPLHRNGAGQPIGIMASAAWGMDHHLLQLGHALLTRC